MPFQTSQRIIIQLNDSFVHLGYYSLLDIVIRYINGGAYSLDLFNLCIPRSISLPLGTFRGILVRIRMIISGKYSEIVNAQGMGFSRRAATSSAKSLIKEITESILTSEVRTRRRREVNHDKFLLGVEVILADLLMAYVAKSSSWAYRSLFRQSFVGEVIGADTFNNIIRQLQKLKYV
jgi:hypothetical protein